jgi:transposase
MDVTELRWFPPLRAAWAVAGEQAEVLITGENDKRALWGALNPRSGHGILHRSKYQRQEDFMTFLRRLRRAYPGRPILLLLDQAGCHKARKSQALARQLDIELLWLPKQCPELNLMDQLWRPLKQHVSANRQFSTVDAQADEAEAWVRSLTRIEVLRKAGVLAKDFWLRDLLENFWRPT